MKETIKVTFGLTKTGENLFYVEYCKDKCFAIEQKDAQRELDSELIKFVLEPSKEALKYIIDMYNKWYEEYVR